MPLHESGVEQGRGGERRQLRDRVRVSSGQVHDGDRQKYKGDDEPLGGAADAEDRRESGGERGVADDEVSVFARGAGDGEGCGGAGEFVPGRGEGGYNRGDEPERGGCESGDR